MHDDGEYVDAAVGNGLSGTVGDAMTFGDHFGLSGWYDVPPVRVDADAKDTSVVGTQPICIMQTQPGAVDDGSVLLWVRVQRFQHVETRTRAWIERVTSLRRVIEALRAKRQGTSRLDRTLDQEKRISTAN